MPRRLPDPPTIALRRALTAARCSPHLALVLHAERAGELTPEAREREGQEIVRGLLKGCRCSPDGPVPKPRVSPADAHWRTLSRERATRVFEQALALEGREGLVAARVTAALGQALEASRACDYPALVQGFGRAFWDQGQVRGSTDALLYRALAHALEVVEADLVQGCRCRRHQPYRMA